MSDGYDPSKILTWVLGIASSLVAAGVISMVAMLISMGNRLASIEATMNQNREERRAQDADLRSRIERLEARIYGEARE